MIKKTITFEDFNGNQHTQDLYFHLSKFEMIEMEFKGGTSYLELLERIIDEEDEAQLIEHFKEILLMSYGIKTEDGMQFRKTQEIREQLLYSPAFPILFDELTKDTEAAIEFANGIMPNNLTEEELEQTRNEMLKKLEAKGKIVKDKSTTKSKTTKSSTKKTK